MSKNSCWKNIKAGIIHLFFPNRCPFCGGTIPFRSHCCEDCQKKSELWEPVVWKECADWHFDAFAAPFLYGMGAEQGVYELKFHGNITPAEHFGYFQYQCLVQAELTGFDVITAVPMAKRQKRRRGYNQAAKLGKAVSRYSGKPYLELLKKPKQLLVQHTLSLEERKRNVIGAFCVREPFLAAGKTVLLVDDILTTGATMDECARVLKQAGAKSVIAAAVCRVSKEKWDLEKQNLEKYRDNMV